MRKLKIVKIISISTFFFIACLNLPGCSNAGNDSNMSLIAVMGGGGGGPVWNGIAQWAKSVTTGPGNSIFNSVAVGSDGIYAAGYLNGKASAYDFGNGKTVTINNANNNVLLVKYQ